MRDRNMICNKHRLTLLVLSTSLLVGAQQATAFSSMTTTITNYCGSNGYDLLPAYESDSCSECHSDNQAKSAYSDGNYEFFCPAPLESICTDADNDGYYAEGEICGTLADFNDSDPSAYPGAMEICIDGIDNDGNGLIDVEDPNASDCPVNCTDADGDGFFAEGESCGTPADFNDSDMSAFPGAAELCGDGVDNDGNGLTDAADPNAVECPAECTDMDIDGYSLEGGSCGAVDCDDNNADVNPGAAEICSDNIDNNCNGLTDTADMNAVDCPIDCTDVDGDGYSIEGGSCGAIDCDDNKFDINPGALEVCDDGIDNNCNALVDDTDSVCQSENDDGGDESDNPWWRSHPRHKHDHDRNCDNHEDRKSDDESDEDEKEEDDNVEGESSSDDREGRRSRHSRRGHHDHH